MILNKWACKAAAEIGNLDLLKYLQKEGCEINDYVLYNAGKNGHVNIVKWIIENRLTNYELNDWIYHGILNSGYAECAKMVYNEYNVKKIGKGWVYPNII